MQQGRRRRLNLLARSLEGRAAYMATWRALYLRQTVGLSEIDAARELMDNYPVLRAELNRYISERIYGPRDRTGAIPIRQDDEEGVN